MNNNIFRYVTLLLLLALPTAVHAQINAFGLASEISHNSVFVSHPVPSEEAPGSVYIYKHSADTESWEVVNELSASDGTVGDAFGYQIAIHGDYLAIGAPSLDGNGGAVYIFTLNALTNSWVESLKLSGSKDAPIGGTVSLMGETLVTGSMVGVDSTHSVSVYTRGEQGFEFSGSLNHDSTTATDLFGASTVLADNGNIYVGAPGANEGAGVIYQFANHDGSWHGEVILDGNDERINGKALGAVIQVVNGSMLLAGAPGIVPNVQPTAPPPAGKLIWAGLNETGLEVHQVLDSGSDGEVDLFGLGFNAHHSTLVAGTPIAVAQKGAAMVFQLDSESNQWTQTSLFEGGQGDVLFGMIISAHDSVAVVSAPGTNLGKGTVRIATLNSETQGWSVSESLMTGKELVLLSSGSVECEDGVAGQFECGNIDLLSYMTVEDLGGASGINTNDLWGWVDPETNREYAIVGRTNGTSFVDITDPANPTLIGDLPLTEGASPSSWRDIKVYANHAYIVADNAGPHGMQVFDLTRLRDTSDAPTLFTHDAHYDGVASAHNVVINEDTGFAYIVGSGDGGETCGGGLHMVNIQDPVAPEFVGCFADITTGRRGTGYSHDAQCVIYEGPDNDYQGQEICFNSNETALSISDVTDKSNPIAVSVAEYPNVAYTHQGWLTEDFQYFYMNDELDELQEKVIGTRTLIWDVSDLDDPLLVGEFFSDNLSSDHNLYIQGDLMYQSNYRSGLRIFDISDRTNPVLTGFFDTFPLGSDRPGFDGSWSNYPFFPSGTIIVSSIGEGLFVLKKQELDI
ncbi:MAG: choice-of-anchor B family protein [Bacteroidetes bacterium]|nr:choice-of-anchor B family protein [Bacteroidota bacterium]